MDKTIFRLFENNRRGMCHKAKTTQNQKFTRRKNGYLNSDKECRQKAPIIFLLNHLCVISMNVTFKILSLLFPEKNINSKLS